MENVSTNDTAKRTSEGPNIIGNAEEGPRPSGINFKPFMHHEENKRPAANEKLSLDQFARKVSNKNNLLYTLSVKGKTAHFPLIFRVSGQIYLPERRYCTMEYIRALLNGRKRYFKNDELRKVKVPRYKQLTFTKVLDYCSGKPTMMSYLPNQRLDGEPTCDREFLFTILNTLDPDYFPAQLRAVEEEKKEKMESKSEDVIEVRPEIMDLINAFDYPIKSKGSGRALCMLKMGAKKRKTPRTSGMFAPGSAATRPGTTTKRMKPNPATK